MVIYKAIKKSMLGYLILLCGLLILSGRLQAASAAQFNAQESYDYTLQNYSDQVSKIEEEAYLDIEEMPRELTIILQVASKGHSDVSQLLAVVAEDVQNKQYYKYLFASKGLLVGSEAQQKAHDLNYHLVKAPEGPVVWQVLSFLDQRSYLEVKRLILPKETQLCLSCAHMAMHLFGKKLPVHKAGCQGQPFPTTAAPAEAISCFYSDRFTDQQQRLVISKIGDQAFPKPKKPITSPSLPVQPLQPVTTQNQLHTAVQLQFPIDTIQLLLTSPQIDINTLDSSGKTPLDYATQGSDLYHLLIGHNAKTSQQLTQHQAPVLLSTTAALASLPSEKGQQQAHKAAEEDTLPVDQLLIPANGQCLYTTVIMGYLLPVRQAGDEVTARIDQLFGMQPAYYLNELHQTLQNPIHYLTYLHSDAFSTLVTAFMARIQIKKGTWGGPAEIQTIATKLTINIQEYYPDPSNLTNLIQSDLTKPVQANATITIHIVRDKVHPVEVLSQVEQASAKDNPHYQHYRLKYTLPLSSPAPVLPTTTHAAIPAIQTLAPTQSAKATTLTVPSSAPMDTTIHPLKNLLKDTPYEIAWQGWVDMAAYGHTLQATYAIVTLEGILYTLQDRLSLHTKSHITIDRTIKLADYGFVLNIDVHKPDSFVLAKVNPANTTLTVYNTFALETPTTDTLADELISYVGQTKIDTTQVNRFLDWLVAEEMDEEALIADIMDKLPDDQSNIYQQFPVLYKLISEWLPKLHKDKIHPNTLVGKDQQKIPQAQAIPLLYALRTITHHYLYIDTEGKKATIYSLGRDTTLVEDKDKEKAQQEKADIDVPTPATSETDIPQRKRIDLNPPHRRPLRSRSGWARYTTSATQHGITIDTTHYHLVPLVYQIAEDHTATTTCYCLVPPSYKTTYQNFAEMMTTHQRMAIQRFTHLHKREAHDLRSHAEYIDWYIAKRKAFQVYFELTIYFLQTPDRILWQGWVIAKQDNQPPTHTYCLVTDDDKLYLSTGRNSLNSPNPQLTATIDLADYSFISPNSSEDNSFIVATSNKAISAKKSEATFSFYPRQPITSQLTTINTLQDELIFYLIHEGVDQEKILQLIDWLAQEEMDEEALIADVDSDTPNLTTTSNLANSLSAIFSKVNTFVNHQKSPYIKNELTHPSKFVYRQDDKLRTLFHTLRQATHQYYYVDTKLAQQPKLCPFNQAAPLATNAYQVVQISCQTPAHNTPTNLYCLLPRDYQPTYQDFAQLCQAYFNTSQLQLTSHGEKTALDTNQNTIHWDTKTNKAFTITLPATLPKKALCRLLKREASQQKLAKKQSTKQVSQKKRKKRSNAPQQATDLFAYEAKFGKMNRLCLWALSPLQKLQDPRLLLKRLLAEVIDNGYFTYMRTVKLVKYVTPKEWSLLAAVHTKINHDTHCALGKPLNIAEMAAIKLYTDYTDICNDLSLAQRRGNLSRWQVWDQLLMTALLKLHLAELALANEKNIWKRRGYTFSGLAGIQFAAKEKIGFFKTYISTSTAIEKAEDFANSAGMLMYVEPEMQQQFINCNVRWISQYKEEEEILFARSADIEGFPAPKWKATLQGNHMKNVQKVIFSPAAAPLIIPKGATHTLPVQAMSHAFSYIKIEEDATLTIVPWKEKVQQNGGHLSIRCYGDCMLGKNAKINVSAKGYSGSTSPQYHGHGPSGGAAGTYCAAGGGNSTAGGSGQCRDAFEESTTYHASSRTADGQVILTKNNLQCGSGGGYLAYPNSSDDTTLSSGAHGAPGGGALYLEIDGQLQLAKNSAFLANGGEATPLTGGAGSGGTICLALKGEVKFTHDKAKLRINTEGGSNQKAIAPKAQGAGGAGHITLYMNQQNQQALKRFVTQPPALVLYRRQVEQCKKRMTSLVPQQLPHTSPATRVTPTVIPDHVTMLGKYYNAQGVAHAEKANYLQATRYYKAALALQTKKYGKQPHPDKANTLLHCAKVAAYQGNYTQAIKDGRAALEIREKLYQAKTPAHTAIIEVHTQLGWFQYQQGRHTQALPRLEDTLQLWQKHHGDQQDLLLIDTYNYIGLVQQSLGKYQQAIDHYHKKAQMMAQSASGVDNSLKATTLHYIGKAQTHMGQYKKATGTHHKEIALLAALHGQDRPHPDKARSLRGEALAYLKQGNAPLALQRYRIAFSQLQKVYGEKATHPDMATALSGIARTHAAQGNLHLAAIFYRKSQTMHQDIYGKEVDHPAIANNLDDLGDLALQQQRTSEAMTFYQRAYKMKKALYGQEKSHLAIALSHANIGQTLLQANQLEKALAEQKKSLAMAAAIYGEGAHIPIIGRLQCEIGLVYQAMHDYDKAQAACTRSLKIYTVLFGDHQPHPDTAATLYARGKAYLGQKKYDQALQDTLKALKMRQTIYQQVPHHPTISAALSQLGCIHATQAQYDSAIHYYVLATHYQVTHLRAISDIDQHLVRFVFTNASPQKRLAHGEHPSPLHEKSIIPFLHEASSQVLLLHGDAGAGKSLYGRFLEKELWTQCPTTLKAMQTAPYTIPLFINLSALQDPTQNAVLQALQQYGWDKNTIAYFKAQLRKKATIAKEEEKAAEVQLYQIKDKAQSLGIDASFIIILDGYDEINKLTKPLNIYVAHQLNEWHAKIVITCRTEHLESIPNYAHYFALHGKGLIERYICPFDAQQIDHYLDKTAQEAPAKVRTANHWTKEKYQDALKQIPTLQELIKSPFLLRIITTILPEFQSKDNSEITRTAVYTAFTDQWIQKELTRMQITGKAAQQKAAAAKAYAAALGFELFFQEEQVLRTNSSSKTWQRFFEDSEPLTYLSLLPLRKVGAHQYQFIHKSCLEFFAAHHIHHSLAQLHVAQEDLKAHFAQQVKPYQSADREMAIQDSQAYSRYATSCPPINQKLLKTEPAIIEFLQDGLWKRKVNIEGFMPSLLQQWLFHLIAASANNPKVAIAAANAITILATRVSLADRAWKGIQIPDAVLDRAFLLRTDMQGANLKRVSLREAYLEGVQCQHTQVAGLDFGEYPYFEHDDDNVYSVSWSHDDRFLASAGKDKSVRVWDRKTGKQVQICLGHEDALHSVSWSHDDCFLASASLDNSVRVWDRKTGKQVQICHGHNQIVTSVSWSHDDCFLASASMDHTVRVWDAKTGMEVQICKGHTGVVNSVSWSHDGRFLASASGAYEGFDHTVRVWDPQRGGQVQICQGHGNAILSVSWSHDDCFLASASGDNTVRVWDAKTGQQVQIYQGHTDTVTSVSWSQDDRFLASASVDKSVHVWNAKTGLQMQIYHGYNQRIASVSWSHDGRFLASASGDKRVRVWAHNTGGQVQICQGHEKGVNSVSWSHDDRFLASTSWDKSVRVWDAKTEKQVQICLGHGNAVLSVSWSHDDRFLASASADKSVRVWDAKTGGQVQICLGHTDWVRSVSWSHDDRFLASTSWDKSVRVWDAKTGQQVQICLGHSSRVNSVSWSHDDRFLASASSDKTVRVWDPKTGQQVQICLGHTEPVTSVSWSHHGHFLASASGDKTVRVWDSQRGSQVQICQGHTESVYSVSWSHDDCFLASASQDKSVRVWDPKKGKQVQICQEHNNAIGSVSWSHDDRFLASASDDKTVRVWDRQADEQVQICEKDNKSITSVNWSHDDHFLASASGNKSMSVWNPKTGKQVQICQGHYDAVLSVSWSHDDRFLASASHDKSVRVWERKTGQQVQICLGHSSAIYSVSWSHDDRFLASASADKSVRVWESKTGQQVQICHGHFSGFCSVSWSHDNRFLASASKDKSVRVWESKNGQQVQICQGHIGSVASVSWSHDDCFLASASADNTVRVWDAKTGQQVQICHGHTDSVSSVSWSHDGRFLASASADKTVRVWDAKTGEQVQICQGHDSYVLNVSWSHSDRFLASASADNTVRVWAPQRGGQVQICHGHDDAVMSVSWSHDDRFLASASLDKTMRVWDAQRGGQVQIYQGDNNAVNSVSWSDDDASASGNKSMGVWGSQRGKQVQICQGHDHYIWSVSWSHDSRFLASASADKSVRIWNPKTGKQVQICQEHDNYVMNVSWSHDDRFLASASRDKSVRIWDTKTGKQVQMCLGHEASVNSVSWSHDDRFLASASGHNGGSDNTVRVWDAKTGRQVKMFLGHTESVNSVSWSHDDRFLASASGYYEGSDNTVRIWDAESGRQVQSCQGHDYCILSVSWSHDDRFLASASHDKSVRVWEAQRGVQVQICQGHKYDVLSVSWSHDDRFLASASVDNSVRIWDAKTGRQVQICERHTDSVTSVSWSHDDRFLASASVDKSVRVWDMQRGGQVKIYEGDDNAVNSVSWSHDDSYASGNKSMGVWGSQRGKQVQICQGHDHYIWSVSWSHDSRFLASASADKSVRIWNPKTGKQVQICQEHDNYVMNVSWSHDDRFLASASRDKSVRIWDTKTGKQVQICLGHEASVNSVSWSHDDRFLASASDDNTVRVWDTKTGRQVKMFLGHTESVNSVSWSHDGRFLASASGYYESSDNTVRIWDAKSGRQVQSCQGHDYCILSVSWSHNDRFLASASHDKSVRVWEAQRGVQVQICQGHKYDVLSVSWSHDDRFLASASADNSVRIWDAKTGRQVQICERHTDSVTSVSWSHDDRFLASASVDKSVRVWDRVIMPNNESSPIIGTLAEQKKEALTPKSKEKSKPILPKECRLVLIIGATGLVLKDADFSETAGLSDMNRRLIYQRDGIVTL